MSGLARARIVCELRPLRPPPPGQGGLKGCLAGFPPFNRHLRDQVALGGLQLLVFRVAGDADVGI
jgi:hypothetical protein